MTQASRKTSQPAAPKRKSGTRQKKAPSSGGNVAQRPAEATHTSDADPVIPASLRKDRHVDEVNAKPIAEPPRGADADFDSPLLAGYPGPMDRAEEVPEILAGHGIYPRLGIGIAIGLWCVLGFFLGTAFSAVRAKWGM